MDSGEHDDTWWCRTPSFFMTMQGVTPLLLSWISCAAGNGRFWNIHRTRPIWSMRLRSLHQSERTTARDPVQYKRWTYPCYKAVNREHQQRWTRWWCTRHSKHLAGGDKWGTILKVRKCCTPVNKAISENLLLLLSVQPLYNCVHCR